MRYVSNQRKPRLKEQYADFGISHSSRLWLPVPSGSLLNYFREQSRTMELSDRAGGLAQIHYSQRPESVETVCRNGIYLNTL